LFVLLHKEQMTLTLSRRRGVKKGQKYGLDKTRKYVYRPVNKELMGSSRGRNSVVECQLPKIICYKSVLISCLISTPYNSQILPISTFRQNIDKK